MMANFNINDTVLLFGQYEGIVMQQNNDQVMVYCPKFNENEPYIITHEDNVILLAWHTPTTIIS